ncbi:MAG: multiheme c-type cytochrome [Verrucomicrobiales bacterium]|nr:multiheme c-type cytochrome [Verrucomicrobiales bacterium]
MPSEETSPRKKKYVRAVGPRLRILLFSVFVLFALLGANSAYLSSITFLEWFRGETYQNYFYQFMFLGHLVLGLLILLPVIFFGIFHIKNAWNRPNKRAASVGYALFAISLILLFSGLALMRVEGFEIKNPELRSVMYWAHVITPFLAVWLYILHRLAGPKIKWKAGVSWAAAVGVVVVVMVALHTQDPRKWNVVGPKEGVKYFEPSLARTSSGNFIPAETLMMDKYCQECHPDVYEGWFHSVHHFSSFNNEPYFFSISETRKKMLERDGDVKASRWCAGCHDPVPFFSGAFDDPKFDTRNHPTAHAGITCTVCHAITHVNSTKGNADYTIEEPVHYPFAKSDNALLRFINRQMVKAKPEFHKKTFLKPLHKTPEFCSTCHKVSLPFELNHYKEWLRGQNHYDNYHLSGVSGHAARSFYYPPKAVDNCNKCHMPLKDSEDFGADFFAGKDEGLKIHSHLFPAANTGIAHIRNEPDIVKVHEEFLKGSVVVDIFGVKEGGEVDGKLIAPIRPSIPSLEPGREYLLEVVVRTMRVGHLFSQGTVDSNEIWIDVALENGGKTIGRSGGLGEGKEVDPWSHFLNVYMLDKDGNRIDRRNAQDIFTPLYNNQMPPGTGQVVHYRFKVPEDAKGEIDVSVKLQYRKFDAKYMKYIYPDKEENDLPIVVMSSDTVTFPVDGEAALGQAPAKPEWQRWNDYGIGLLLKGNKGSEKGELIQAEAAFKQVEALGQASGPLNLARVYVKEGRLEEAVEALGRAVEADPPAPPWTVAWFNGVVNKQNGFLDKAIENFRSIVEDRSQEMIDRGFDFSQDYVALNELGQTLFERAKMERANEAKRNEFLDRAIKRFEQALSYDSENLTAHYNLSLIHSQLGDEEKAAAHRRLHEKYRPDDNARDKAVAAARRSNPAADNAAQAITIYKLQRKGAPGLDITIEEESPAAGGR